MSRLSIVIPVYNTEKYLSHCLESVLNQQYEDFEVICIDDGSTDQSGEILDRYEKKDSRIIVIHKKNEGYGKTMNLGIELAKGKYFGIVEPDDTILSEMYLRHVKDMDEYRLDFLKTDFYTTWHQGDGSTLDIYNSLSGRKDLYNRVLDPQKERGAYFFEKYTWNGLYRTSFLREHRVKYQETSGAAYQDNGFWFQTMYNAKRILFRKEAYYCYTKDNENASAWDRKKVTAFQDEYDYIHRYLDEKGEQDKTLYQILFHCRLMGYLLTLHRIEVSMRESYARFIVDEYEKYSKLGEVSLEWIPSAERCEFDSILEDWKGYANELNEKELRLYQAIKGWNKIIVYGGGIRGRTVSWQLKGMLEDNQELVVAVTKRDKDHLYCLEHKIYELRDFQSEQKDCLVVLAVKKASKAYDEMKKYMKEIGFTNCYEP